MRRLIPGFFLLAGLLGLAACGGGGTDASITVSAPTITTQPASATVTVGAAASFSVVASGSGLAYQWSQDGTAISGATSASYSIATTTTASAGSYTVVVSNTAGSVTSSAAVLTVNAATSAPTITTQPTSVTVAVGATATFAVVASGATPLTYQWSKAGTAISGATASTYSIATVAAGDAGSYTVTVTNSLGSVTSSAVTLTIGTATSCSSGTYAANVVCAVTAFNATLTSAQLATAQYLTTGYTTAQLNVYKTRWSNLPGVTRSGIQYSALTTTDQRTAFLAVARAALTDAGYADFTGVRAADDYLGTLQNGYSGNNYYVAMIGTPSATGFWTLQLGGHHMAFNISFNAGLAYPTPHHIGVEPKAAFTVNSATYTVLADKASATTAIFYGQTNSLAPTSAGSSALSAAYLTGQTFSDILIGPVEYGTGSYTAVAAKYPTSSRGVLVSTLTTAQQALVTAAITQFVSDYDATTAARLIADYTSTTAYASTYVAWGGPSGAAYPNVDTNTTYMRIDGPKVWIEISCQSGVVIQGATHYHMMFRDKVNDYYNELSTN